MRYFWLCLLLALNACNFQDRKIEEIPLVPLWQVREAEGILPIRAPLHVHDQQYRLIGYTATGERNPQLYDDILFPTDVILVFTQEMEKPRIFLARSPHGGCLVAWLAELEQLHDPCYGSGFTLKGEYLNGPSQRNLDELPGEVRNEMVWVRGEIIYGKSHN